MEEPTLPGGLDAPGEARGRSSPGFAHVVVEDKVDRLRTRLLATVGDLIPEAGEPFALVDFPDHENIGDSAIYVGEHDILRARGLSPSYVCTQARPDWSALALDPDRTIFIHGGGNFGDLWPEFQLFREQVLTRFPGRRVVQFPQTIYYRDRAAIERTARVIDAHRAFVLLVRDKPSFELATRHFSCEVRLCPDMAFGIERTARGAPKVELLLHLREDQEAAGLHDSTAIEGAGVVRADWPQEDGTLIPRVRRRVIARSLLTMRIKSKARMRHELFAALARTRLKRGIDLLSSARLVITDRLHGHIICTLLGIPHAVIDNSYGKVGAFMEQWGTGSGRAYLAATLADAVQILRDEEGLTV